MVGQCELSSRSAGPPISDHHFPFRQPFCSAFAVPQLCITDCLSIHLLFPGASIRTSSAVCLRMRQHYHYKRLYLWMNSLKRIL
jgi:hypothetical protein